MEPALSVFFERGNADGLAQYQKTKPPVLKGFY
jgi:hypothetical protein